MWLVSGLIIRLINIYITVQYVVNLGIIVGFAQISLLSMDELKEHKISLLKASVYIILLVI
jgi:hypothetical protein